MPKRSRVIDDEASVSGSGQTTPKKRLQRFRIRAQRFIITYSQIQADFDQNKLGPFLKSKFFDHDELVHQEYILIAVEEHPNTGGYHVHIYVDVGDNFIINEPTILDYCGYHPNIKAIRTTPFRVYEYVLKDGDIIFEEGEPPKAVTKVSADDKWSTIMEASSKEEFMERANKMAPRDTVLHYTSVDAYASWRYRQIPSDYAGPGIDCHCADFPQLTDWVQKYIHHPYSGRPISLVIWGKTKIGKTLWARSLGKHAYFPGLFILEGFTPTTVRYAIFDDLINKMATVPNFKAWFGGQQEFVIGDKYMKKQRIAWGKPCIYIGNSDPRLEMSQDDTEWLNGNCLFAEINSVLASPSV